MAEVMVPMLYFHLDCQQVEHSSDRPDDLLQRSSCEYSGIAGPVSQV